jgi:hypothetical protein
MTMVNKILNMVLLRIVFVVVFPGYSSMKKNMEATNTNTKEPIKKPITFIKTR